MTSKLIKNANIVNEGKQFIADVLIEDQFIAAIDVNCSLNKADQIIDAQGKYLIPGMIDDQVHFRDPGLTHKGDLESESKAAVAGGITSFMEMPNTNPRTLTQELLEEKFQIAAQKSWANYSFYMGTSNDNLNEVLKTDPNKACGIKIFLGASTGNMLVDNQETIAKVLEYSSQNRLIVTVHSEDENIIKSNIQKYIEKYGPNLDLKYHSEIRSVEACYKSTEKIIKLAKETKGNLHVLHLSTAKEMELFEAGPIANKKITAEVCVHHLFFSEEDYKSKGNKIKWNPAIKSKADRDGLRKALIEDKLDIIATDHAPHTLEEKSNLQYLMCPSGGPLVEHALVACLEMYHQGLFTLEKLVEKLAHAPSTRFRINKRGFIREGYYADLVLVDLNSPWQVNQTLYKCGWSPFDGDTFKSKILKTFVNGDLVFDEGSFKKGNAMKLSFDECYNSK